MSSGSAAGTPPRQGSSAEMHGTIKRSEWMASVLRSNPTTLALRERYAALSDNETTFAALPHPAYTEVEHVLDRQRMVSLIVQWLRENGYHRTAAEVLCESRVTYVDNGQGPEQLVPLLQASAPENSAVFAATVDGLDATRGAAAGALRATLLSHDDAEDSEVVTNVELPGGVWADFDPRDGAVASAPSVEQSERDALTVDQIVTLMVQGDDPELRHIVSSTHSAWTSAAELMRKLFERYYVATAVAGGADSETAAAAHRSRVVRALVLFAVTSNGPHEVVAGLLSRFAARLTDSSDTKHANELRQALTAMVKSRPVAVPKQWDEPVVPKNIFSPLLTWRDVPVIEVARQLTLLDCALFGQVVEAELLSLGWLSDEERDRRRAPNVCALLQRFAALERWVAGCVLGERGAAQQLSILSYFIDLSKTMLTMNSFHSAMAIAGGVLSQPVWRLRNVFGLLPADRQEALADLQAAASHAQAFGVYNSMYAQSVHSTTAASMPWMLPHLQQIAFASHASPSFADDEDGAAVGGAVDAPPRVNLDKFRALHQLISALLKARSRLFPFLVVVQVQQFFVMDKLEHAAAADASRAPDK